MSIEGDWGRMQFKVLQSAVGSLQEMIIAANEPYLHGLPFPTICFYNNILYPEWRLK